VTKICTICKVSKDTRSFHRNRDRKDGHSSNCKRCHKKFSKEYYNKNKERILAQQKETKKKHYIEHKKEINEKKRIRYKERRDNEPLFKLK
jgi:hypothetical protein